MSGSGMRRSAFFCVVVRRNAVVRRSGAAMQQKSEAAAADSSAQVAAYRPLVASGKDARRLRILLCYVRSEMSCLGEKPSLGEKRRRAL